MPDKTSPSSEPVSVDHGLTLTPALTPIIRDLFGPSIKVVGKEMAKTLQTYIDQRRSKARDKYLAIHIERVHELLNEMKAESGGPRVGLDDKEEEQLLDLIERVQSVDPNEAELSKMWQKILAKMVLGESISEELIRILKELTPGEARMLISVRQNSWCKQLLRWPFVTGLSRNEKFCLISLQQKQLIKPAWGIFTAASLALSMFLGFEAINLYVHQSWHWYSLENKWQRWLGVGLRLSWSIPLILFLTNLIGRELTWIGRELAKYAERPPVHETRKCKPKKGARSKV